MARHANLAVFTAIASWSLVLPLVAQSPHRQKTKDKADARTQYTNSQFGFCFALPASWRGYSILNLHWDGAPLDGGPALTGPIIVFRNPNWTEQNPREDIPIMIFTAVQWTRVAKEGVAVSAAPIGPMEEAERLVRNNPLNVACGKMNGS